MKKKEFLAKVEALGLGYFVTADDIEIDEGFGCYMLASVGRHFERQFEVNLNLGEMITKEKQDKLLELVLAYGMTPLKVRDEYSDILHAVD